MCSATSKDQISPKLIIFVNRFESVAFYWWGSDSFMWYLVFQRIFEYPNIWTIPAPYGHSNTAVGMVRLFKWCEIYLIFLFFSLNNFNYSRRLSSHLYELTPFQQLVQFDAGNWMVWKLPSRFSVIPAVQTHEQENETVKWKWGVISLTENEAAFQNWLVAGPEIARGTGSDNPHLEEGLASRNQFYSEVWSLNSQREHDSSSDIESG